MRLPYVFSMLRLTYVDELLGEIQGIEFNDSVKFLQRRDFAAAVHRC